MQGFVVGESRLLGCVWVSVSGVSEESTGQGKIPVVVVGGSGVVRGILTLPHSPSWVAAIRGQKLNAMHCV